MGARTWEGHGAAAAEEPETRRAGRRDRTYPRMRRIPQLGACVPDSPGADGARRTRRPGGNAADAAEETQCGGRGAGMNGASIQRGAADTADGRQCGGCSGREAMRRTMHTPAAVRSRCVATQRRRRASAAQTGRPANERADGWTNRRMYGHAGIIIDLRAGRPAGTRRTRRDARGYDTRLSAGGVPPGSVRERLRRSMRSTITATAPSPVTLVAVPKLSMAM